MSPTGLSWFRQLKGHVSQHRSQHPLPPASDFAPADLVRYRLLGGTLLAWLNQHGPRLLQERAVFAHLDQLEPDPFVVVISDAPGLVAAAEIVAYSEQIAWATPNVFDSFIKTHPDEEFRWHIEFVNRLIPLAGQLKRRAKKKFPIGPRDEYWLHFESTNLGPLFARSAKHLLKWDGKDLTVLQEAFTTSIS